MIKLSDITLAFGHRELIAHASTEFTRGNLIALLGRNGTGKSTLLRAIAALGSVQGGTIEIDGRPIGTLSPTELARNIAFVNTERIEVEAMTARELVAIGRSPYTDWMGRLTDDDHTIINKSMRMAGVESLANRKVDTLSDGECQRVMIARALAQQTPIILLDEPTAFLDLPNRYELCTLLATLAHTSNRCIIFSTHELDIALTLADSIALVDTPHLTHLPTEDMIASGNIERLFLGNNVHFDTKSRSIRFKRE